MALRTLFTAATDHVQPNTLDEEIDDLVLALHDEFPAYWVSGTLKADDHVAFVVCRANGSMYKNAVPDPRERLAGWGHGWLTLQAVK